MEPSDRSHRRAVWLIVATLAAFALGYAGWQAFIVRNRRAMCAQLVAGGDVEFTYYPGGDKGYQIIRPAEADNGVSLVRRLLGDQETNFIIFSRPFTAADREAIKAFPESKVLAVAKDDLQFTKRRSRRLP